jgi:hypothetical protein
MHNSILYLISGMYRAFIDVATSPQYRPIIVPISGISYRYRILLFKNIAFGPPLGRGLRIGGFVKIRCKLPRRWLLGTIKLRERSVELSRLPIQLAICKFALRDTNSHH